MRIMKSAALVLPALLLAGCSLADVKTAVLPVENTATIETAPTAAPQTLTVYASDALAPAARAYAEAQGVTLTLTADAAAADLLLTDHAPGGSLLDVTSDTLLAAAAARADITGNASTLPLGRSLYGYWANGAVLNALLGDGALTGGLAYEGLNNAGSSGEPLIVILNDNGMSIDGNVGAVSEHLGLLRSKPAYYEFKKAYRDLLDRNAVGRAVYDFNHHLKTNVKKALLPNSTMFEDMGFTYLGPVNGHDVGQLTNTLKWAKDLNCPVLVHVHTKKGKGYPPAEREPERYHGVGKFDPRMGVSREHKRDFSAVFGDELCKLAKNDETICTITAAMRDGTGLHDFSEQYPVRFFDVGIAEGHAVAMAAGMAKQGLTPVVAIYSSFLQRAYDQLIHDTALSDLHVVFAVDRAGMVGADGETHHGIFDATFLSEIPNMTVLCPSNFAELRTMLDRAVNEIKGPVAIRYPRGGEGNYKEDSGRQNLVVLREGEDITLCAYGTMINNVLDAAEILHEQGIEARVVKINAISPLYDRDMREVIGKTKAMLVAEECAGVGCMGQRMAAILGWNKISPERLELCNLGKAFPAQGTVEELYREFGLDAESLAKKAAEVLQ